MTQGSMAAGTRGAAGTGSELMRGTAIAVVIAAVMNLIVFAIGSLGEPVQVVEPGASAASDLPLVAVLFASVLPLLVGAAGLWLLEKVSARGFRIWIALVAVLVVASLASPLALDVDTTSKVVLSVMHFVVGGAAIMGQLLARRR